MDEFTAALNNFQAAQRQAAEKEKASVARAQVSSGYLNVTWPGTKIIFSLRNVINVLFLLKMTNGAKLLK